MIGSKASEKGAKGAHTCSQRLSQGALLLSVTGTLLDLYSMDMNGRDRGSIVNR